ASARRHAVHRFHPVDRSAAHDAGGRVFSLEPECRARAEPRLGRAEERGRSGAHAELRATGRAHADIKRTLQETLPLTHLLQPFRVMPWPAAKLALTA